MPKFLWCQSALSYQSNLVGLAIYIMCLWLVNLYEFVLFPSLWTQYFIIHFQFLWSASTISPKKLCAKEIGGWLVYMKRSKTCGAKAMRRSECWRTKMKKNLSQGNTLGCWQKQRSFVFLCKTRWHLSKKVKHDDNVHSHCWSYSLPPCL